MLFFQFKNNNLNIYGNNKIFLLLLTLILFKAKNFPPLPSWCPGPLKPCFYQDISVEIPLEFQVLEDYNYIKKINYVL